MRHLVVIVLLAAGCRRVAVDLTGRPCDGGVCSDGFVCHPESRVCVEPVPIDCDGNGVCPEALRTGDACDTPGSFVPCDSRDRPCERGCRTCRDGAWSPCSMLVDCELGEPATCDRCDHDCTTLVQHAFAICERRTGGFACSYAGDCATGYGDADGDRANGCECALSGAEVCDGVDNDCNGVVDDDDGDCAAPTPDCNNASCECNATSCDSGDWCSAGDCLPCADDDPAHCGLTCARCSGGTPDCVSGACRCNVTSCGSGAWCDAGGSCRACGATDPLHCGSACAVCSGETPTCSGGACVCNGTSCPAGKWCGPGGACLPCDDAGHCGPACAPCGTGLVSCNATTGSCSCVAGSCPAGQVCRGGACVSCACPAMFPACSDLGGGNAVCRCSGASCGAGGVCSADGRSCVWSDDFDSSSSLQACGAGITQRSSSWARGPTTDLGLCRSGNCWATNLSGPYNACEQSCLASPTLNLQGVTGTLALDFWAAYDFEDGWDGATVELVGSSGPGQVTPEAPGWDTIGISGPRGNDNIQLGNDTSSCPGTYLNLRGWGQYYTFVPRAWELKSFRLSSTSHPAYFWSGFYWRLWALADINFQNSGIQIDDATLTVTQSP